MQAGFKKYHSDQGDLAQKSTVNSQINPPFTSTNNYIRALGKIEKKNHSQYSFRAQISCPGSGTTLRKRDGNISSGDYMKGDVCIWKIAPDNLNLTEQYPIQLGFLNFDFYSYPYCDYIDVYECESLSCTTKSGKLVASFYGWRNPPMLSLFSQIILLIFSSESFTWCPIQKSSFVLSYLTLCPAGYYGAIADNCRPCKKRCYSSEVLLGSCPAGSKFDSTWCGCPKGQYRSKDGSCLNCNITCNKGSRVCFIPRYSLMFVYYIRR